MSAISHRFDLRSNNFFNNFKYIENAYRDEATNVRKLLLALVGIVVITVMLTPYETN